MIDRMSLTQAIGIEEIDVMQEALVDRASRLVEAARARRAMEARAHVERMREVATHLFESEERHLRAAGCRSLERHAGQHRRFLTDLLLLGRELGRGEARLICEQQAARHVAAWLEAHLGQTDRELERLAPRAALA
jgi:hemerythrin-like metal-binding protein